MFVHPLDHVLAQTSVIDTLLPLPVILSISTAPVPP
jgi:hypothetical protein